MTRREAEQAVIEAARAAIARMKVTPMSPWEVQHLIGALARLDALPAEDAGEVVEAAVWEDTRDGEILIFRVGHRLDREGPNYGESAEDYQRLGVVRLPLVREEGR